MTRRPLIRRDFLKATALGLAGTCVPPRSASAASRYAWPAEDEDYRDPVTGAWVRVLTPNIEQAQKIYQTHPMWTCGMHYGVFFVLEDGVRIPHARQMASGIVRPLTTDGVGATVLDPEGDNLYFVRDRTVHRQPVVSTFQRLRKAPAVAALPDYVERVVGGISLDATAKVLYAGVALDEAAEKWGIAALDLRSNVWRMRAHAPFQVGHVQAHPSVPGLIMFCHETGGDAPQRMWRIADDMDQPEPYFEERGEEWVTHEIWWNKRALYTIWPYNEERLNYQYGIVSIDLAGGDFQWHSKYKAWHTHGSPDGQWILGDDFDRNLWLISSKNGERRLITQGHNGEGFQTHPHASFTPDSKAVVLNSSHLGREAVFLVELPEWDALPAPAQT